MNQSVLMYTDIYKHTEIYYISHRTVKHHSRL